MFDVNLDIYCCTVVKDRESLPSVYQSDDFGHHEKHEAEDKKPEQEQVLLATKNLIRHFTKKN